MYLKAELNRLIWIPLKPMLLIFDTLPVSPIMSK